MGKEVKITIHIISGLASVSPIKRRVYWLNIGLNIGIRRDFFNVTDLYTSKAQCRYNNFKRIRSWINHYLYE